MHVAYKKLLLICLAAFAGGCASVVSGDEQVLSLTVKCRERIYPAFCKAENAKGTWYFNTPESKTILRDSSALEVTCNSPSFGSFGGRTFSLPNPLIVGNFISGGVAGVLIDATSKSFWFYPPSIFIEHEFCRRLTK